VSPASARKYAELCFSNMPNSRKMLRRMRVPRGWLPSRVSGPTSGSGPPLVWPHSAMALSPKKAKWLSLTSASRLRPLSMSATPSSRRKEQLLISASSVPSRKTAAWRAIAQSPDDGNECGSRYVMAESRKPRPTSDTFAAPETLRSTFSLTSTKPVGGGAVPLEALWKSVSICVLSLKNHSLGKSSSSYTFSIIAAQPPLSLIHI
jgi:hypothetical protein